MDLPTLVAMYIQPLEPHRQESHRQVMRAQLSHRIHLVRDLWCIPEKARVLEIGCGQGDMTLVLAAAVGEAGRVDAVDPCELDYGSPFTVGESQAHLKSGRLGARMNFIQADPQTFLSTSSQVYDYAVLHCSTWYFSSPTQIATLLTTLFHSERVKKILLAEWSLRAFSLTQIPHVLAALARGSLEALDPASSGNIRTLVGPGWFRSWLADVQRGETEEEKEKVLWKERFVTPDLQDGMWEVGSVLEDGFDGLEFERRVVELLPGDGDGGGGGENERRRGALLAMRDAVKSAVEGVDGGIQGVRSMDVWVAEL